MPEMEEEAQVKKEKKARDKEMGVELQDRKKISKTHKVQIELTSFAQGMEAQREGGTSHPHPY